MYYDVILHTLRGHDSYTIVCDDAAQTNVCECRCGVRCGEPRPNYGEARAQYMEHLAKMIDRALTN